LTAFAVAGAAVDRETSNIIAQAILNPRFFPSISRATSAREVRCAVSDDSIRKHCTGTDAKAPP
jgi:hypothetical protein